MPLFKFTAEYFIRASSREEAENEIKEEVGNDVYESHIICEEVKDNSQKVDVDLVKV